MHRASASTSAEIVEGGRLRCAGDFPDGILADPPSMKSCHLFPPNLRSGLSQLKCRLQRKVSSLSNLFACPLEL